MPTDGAESAGIDVGSVLVGKYELRSLIGEGASGRVFEAVHQKTGGVCAVKLLHRGASESDRERMRREAQALARLDHRAIVRLLDYDELPAIESAFIVQELVRGRTLRAVLDEELVLPANRVVEIALALLDALAYAHERGVIHRDIKPENIVLTEGSDGALAAKLVDFGLVRDVGDRSNLTRHGCIAGTPRYMSPEQAWGRQDIDARTDLWSLGVVLYELLSGAPPYDGSNDREVLASIVARDPVHLRSVGVAVDDALADAVMQALVRAPEARVASAKAFHRAIAAAGAPPATDPPLAPAAQSPREPSDAASSSKQSASISRSVVVAAALLFATVVVAAIALRRPEPRAIEPSVERTSDAGTAAIDATMALRELSDAGTPEDVALDAAREAGAEPRRTSAQLVTVRRYDGGARADDRAAHGANGSPIINEL